MNYKGFFNNRHFAVMLPTAAIGIIASILVAVFMDFKVHARSLLLTNVYYPVIYIVCAICFRWIKKRFNDPRKCRSDATWIATIVCLPMWIGLASVLIDSTLAFSARYTLFGITASLIIFEYYVLE